MATDPVIRDALLKKLDVTRQALSLRAQKIKRVVPMTTEEAIYVIAHQEGIDIARRLDGDTLSRVRDHVTRLRFANKGVDLPSVSLPSAGQKADTIPRKRHSAPPKRRGTSVFVVHGRNEKLRRSMFQFLRALGLRPMEWNEALKATGKGAPYVGEVLDAAFRQAAALVILLSPDDEARLRKDFQKASDPPYEKDLTGQARANVLFEAGMAFGHRPESTVLVQVGEVRPFSDVGGRHVVRLDNTAERRIELATKLANAGCNVDTDGTDWLNEGDFVA